MLHMCAAVQTALGSGILSSICVLLVAGTVEDVRKEDGKLLVRPDILSDQVVEMEAQEVQKLFKVSSCVEGRSCWE